MSFESIQCTDIIARNCRMLSFLQVSSTFSRFIINAIFIISEAFIDVNRRVIFSHGFVITVEDIGDTVDFLGGERIVILFQQSCQFHLLRCQIRNDCFHCFWCHADGSALCQSLLPFSFTVQILVSKCTASGHMPQVVHVLALQIHMYLLRWCHGYLDRCTEHRLLAHFQCQQLRNLHLIPDAVLALSVSFLHPVFMFG